MKVRLLLLVLAALGGAVAVQVRAQEVAADVAGEISTKTALLQSRISEAQRKSVGIGELVEGWARFEAADNPEFKRPVISDWVKIGPKNDYTAKSVIGSSRIVLRNELGELLKDEKGRNVTPPSLQAGTLYYWRVRFGPSPAKLQDGRVNSFTTLSGALASRAMRLAVVQGLDVNAPGFAEAVARVAEAKPDYIVFAGNSVAYDLPKSSPAVTEAAMDDRWNRVLSHTALGRVLSQTGTFWQKNDHDYRFAAADPSAPGQPTAELGSDRFRRKVPIVDLTDAAGLTFRHPQFTRDLEVWLPEVRDYRSPNAAPDGKDKSLWGTFQADWVVRSLEGSKVPFKVFIQPTPILGPSLPGDRDSHAGAQGFGAERAMFLARAKELKLAEKGFVILTASPWQYHSVNADGIDELSIGSLSAPLVGAVPMAANLKQPFNPATVTPGFALVEVTPAVEGKGALLAISLIRADTGAVVYKLERTAK